MQNLNVETLLDSNQAFQASTGEPVRFADILVSLLRISASGPPACPVDRQLPEHPGHVPERHHRPQPAVHHHQTDHRHGLPLCRGDGLLDPRGRLALVDAPQVRQDSEPEEFYGGADHQHLPQPPPWVQQWENDGLEGLSVVCSFSYRQHYGPVCRLELCLYVANVGSWWLKAAVFPGF